jgi:hypothetical protein
MQKRPPFFEARYPTNQGHTTKHGKPFHAMQVKRILDRRVLYEGNYRYAGVEADGQHRAIL